MENTFQNEKLGITIKMHGEAVWDNIKNLILGRFNSFKLPEWFIKNHHNIVNNLHNWEEMKLYAIYHDVAKGLVKVVGEDGITRFPNHAEVSKKIFEEYFPAFPEAAELIGLDMLMHTSNITQISEMNLPTKTLMTLLITAFAEIHANAEMFAEKEQVQSPTDSISFKIKYKNLDRIGKRLVEKLEKHNDAYLYVFVREDLPKIQHSVQASHGVFEAAKGIKGHPSFVLLGVEDEKAIKDVMRYLLDLEISFKLFREPMKPYNNAITCIVTELIRNDRKSLFKNYSLLT